MEVWRRCTLHAARCTLHATHSTHSIQVTKAVEEITREELIAVGEEPGRNYRRAVVFYMDQGKSGEASLQPSLNLNQSPASLPLPQASPSLQPSSTLPPLTTFLCQGSSSCCGGCRPGGSLAWTAPRRPSTWW